MAPPKYFGVDTPTGAFPRIAIGAIVIAALYFGRDILVPVALAVLLSFILTPLVIGLQHLRVPKTLAATISVVLAFVVIMGFGYVLTAQLTQLATNLPSYQTNIQTKIENLRTSALTEGVLSRLGDFAERIGNELSSPAEDIAGLTGTGGTSAPVRVQVENPPRGPLELAGTFIGRLIEPLATAGIVIVLVVFILLKRQDLRDRLIRLLGAGDLSKTTAALEDAGARVARYLVMQLVVNVTYGIPIALGLWWIGVPNALLWGMTATVLRFIPYVGPIIAAILPIGLAVAVDPGWSMVFLTVALFVTLELISNNLVEPWLYGSRTGLSTFAIIVAAIFWTWLWGPIGLLLSTPLTVCLVVLGRHVPAFAFLDVLLGSEPVLSPAQRLTQRLLAGDADEATEVADQYLTNHSVLSFYQNVGLPALVAVERDRDQGMVDPDRLQLVADTMLAVVENLSTVDQAAPTDPDGPLPVEVGSIASLPLARARASVLCLGGKGPLDDVVAVIVAELLDQAGIRAHATTLAAISSDDPQGTLGPICLSYLAERPAVRARYLVKRLRRRNTRAEILVALWGASVDNAEKENLETTVGAPILPPALGEFLEKIKEHLQPDAADPPLPTLVAVQA